MSKRAVVITGANGGIGQALCRCFREDGYYVIGTDFGAADESVCDRFIVQDFREIVAFGTCRDSFFDALTVALDGRELKAIINNAALQKIGSVEYLSVEDLNEMLQINLIAPFLMVKQFTNLLSKSGGAVVNIGSIHSELTKPGFVGYATSKAALHGMTRAMAVDLGSKGIRVNVISPAATKTKMLEDGFIGKEDSYQELKSYHPLKRIAVPEEVARLALFLASDDCSFISGAEVKIDGAIGVRLHDPE